MKRLQLLSLLGFAFLVSCRSINSVSTRPQSAPLLARQNSPTVSPKVKAGSEGENSQIVRQQSLYEESLEYVSHPLVQKWINFFTERDSTRFARFLQRGEYFRPFIEESLTARGLPPELYYLALIESGFYTSARSHAQAVGIWQFISATGRRYGLRIDRQIDQRKDPVLSTQAAMSYLSDLHRVYQSWWLAIASYNSGEMSVLRAIMQSGKRDFFDLAEKANLPRETINYVPKFIAAMYIGRNMEQFGIALEKGPVFAPDENVALLADATPSGVANAVVVEKAAAAGLTRHRVRPGENLHIIASKYNISVGKLKRLNRLGRGKIFPGQLLKVKARRG